LPYESTERKKLGCILKIGKECRKVANQMSLLHDYEQRTAWKYEPIHGWFHTADGLNNKVAQDGSYAPFLGSTVVFRFGKRELYIIELMQKAIHQQLDGTEMLASSLPMDAVHMTLHDLVSPEKCTSDPMDRERYNREIAESLSRAADIVEHIRNEYAGRKITMIADRIVNMVSKSLVLMLKPQTESDYELLLELYGRFDEIVSLSYPLTPHITLAYFKPGILNGDKLWEALEAVQIYPDSAPVFEFDAESLTAQVFRDMQSYIDVPKMICFCCDGGLNRSVMAANILNHMAGERGLPIKAVARSAYRNTQGWLVSQQIWDTLKKHGIQPDGTYITARYLEEDEDSHFSDFAGISEGAIERLFKLGLPEKRTCEVSSFFFGVRDPEYGEITYEQAFDELQKRTIRYLDAFERGDRLY